MNEQIGVLVMAYGGPNSLDEVEPYLLDVRGGRPAPEAVVREVEGRYEKIGGRSPILERTRAQSDALQSALDIQGPGFRTFVGMRHWHPYIGEVVLQMAETSIRRIVGIVMAPHYSKLSVEVYFQGMARAVESSADTLEVAHIKSWKDDPGYLDVLEARIVEGLENFPSETRSRVQLILTAHSLPERILEWNDPYPNELQETYRRLTDRFRGQPAHFAYQSAAMTGDRWLGPDAGDLMEELIPHGARDFLVVPIGFVSEHVEILYDIDIEYKRRIEAAGGRLERIEMPGASLRMMSSLAHCVRRTAAESGWM
ncbi:MAG: ferrochelatase [Chloroflexi bacterium]|nr:ferrochelatase [Chloroflexota bacterium]